MPNFVPVNQQSHQAAGFEKVSHYGHAANDALAPVVISEVAKLLPRMPLAFYKSEEMTGFQLVALQGLLPGQNLFLNESNQMLAGYVPACYRGYPFRLFPVDGKTEMLLCIDEDSPFFHEKAEADDESLFAATGEPADIILKIRDFLALVAKDSQKTQELVNLLAEYELITPWHIRLDGFSESQQPLQGLYHIKESALRELSAEQVQVLNLRGALSLAYGQLYSEHRIENLQTLLTLRAQAAQAAQTTEEEIDLDKLFDQTEEDLFRF
ncbi:MAG TPA: SapC family protein [Marinospirillum sp.]|uniref:SapC family protein n=1 Tax=Marinospirillum sp. TaxID=2183934 RepID=UPI002B495A49|nr:SapC family protein [Marinospirillum sp.]HKM15991.1 SapC family protein [Marinospirillum sp.]